MESVGHCLGVSEASPTSLEPNATLDVGSNAEVCNAVSISVHLVCRPLLEKSQKQHDDVQIDSDPPSLSGIHSTEPSDADSAISEVTVTDGRTSVRSRQPATPIFHHSTHAPATPPSEALKPIDQPPVCLEWLAGRCLHRPCSSRHISPSTHVSVNNVGSSNISYLSLHPDCP